MLFVHSQGDPKSRIWLVGEAPGEDEEIAGVPFVGPSGEELNRMLLDANIVRENCYVTNVCPYRPPENKIDKWLKRTKSSVEPGGWKYTTHQFVEQGRKQLVQDIEKYKPELVIGFGNVPLWALTGEWGITSWRGSEMFLPGGVHFVPTIHPAAVLRQYELRALVMQDLKFRCARRIKCGWFVPTYKFNINPTLDEVMEFIDEEEELATDIETSRGKTVCLGVARNESEAICIPFWNYSGRYWEPKEEQEIFRRLDGKVLLGQNWNYDRQYLLEDFGVNVPCEFDTYIAQSVLFPGSERGLGYLSSMNCEHHVYWKEDGKDYNNVKDFPRLFRYNCRDVIATWECAQVQRARLVDAGLWEQFMSRMRYGNDSVFRMMIRGVQRDPDKTKAMLESVDAAVEEREKVVAELAGHPVNFQSAPQVSKLLYQEMGFKAVGRKTAGGKDSTKDENLQKLIEKNPEAGQVCLPILEARSLANLKSNFLEAKVDPDGRLRSSWMATGTETFRLTSSKNAFHRGGPLQNVTDGKHTHSGRPLPNLRSTIVPPEGFVYWNCDLERADVQVVAWEADDAPLKKMLRERADIHLVNAVELFDLPGVCYDECFESHSRYQEHKEKYEQKRHFGKTFCHLTNYGGTARTAAVKCHSTVKEAEKRQKRWFEIHPGILKWHQRTQAQLYANRTIRNKYGYRRVYFGRVEEAFNEALAWVPQSTVSLYISDVQMSMDGIMQGWSYDWGIELQGHDAVSGVLNPVHAHWMLPLMRDAAASCVVPYDDPLIIPLELSMGPSWGEVKKCEWPRA